MSSFGSWQDHVPDVLALVPWADMMRHNSEAGEPPFYGNPVTQISWDHQLFCIVNSVNVTGNV